MKSGFAKFSVITLVALTIVAAVVLVTALAFPSFRYQSFRMISELPGIVTFLSVRRHLIQREFTTAATVLNRHLGWSEKYGVAQSVLLPSLIAQTEFVVERAIFPKEHKALIPYLIRLSAKKPNLYLPQIWLARALLVADPAKSFSPLERAIKLIPADSRAYRIAIEAATTLNDTERIKIWCGRYNTAQFGGPHPHDYNTLFVGTGLRKLALEPMDGKTPLLVENHGLQLNETRTYSFSFPHPVKAKRFRLHVGTVPGLLVHFKGMIIYAGGARRQIELDRLTLTSRASFLVSPHTVLLSARDGDHIGLRLAEDNTTPLSRVDITLFVARPALTNHPACK